jgi:hypothetical protein
MIQKTKQKHEDTLTTKEGSTQLSLDEDRNDVNENTKM